MRPLLDLLRTYELAEPFFPPSDIYSEGWLLRVILYWFSRKAAEDSELSFLRGAGWFSEAHLPSPFLARYQGDPLAESRTHADGVVGHFTIGAKGKTDLALNTGATQLVVLEAKMSSALSHGIKNAPYFDQAARSIACIAEVLRHARRLPGEMSRLGFYVLAPESKILSGAFDAEMTYESIREKVGKRVSAYDGDRDEWFSEWFMPTLGCVKIAVLSWEQILTAIGAVDHEAYSSIGEFYRGCLAFN